MTLQPVRVGLIGAGQNTQVKHVPGLRAIPGVEIVGLVNRSPESSQHVAQQLGIPRTYPTPEALLADRQIDAVVIGTWPDSHADLSVMALAAGKHVLCEARMAANVADARRMMAAAKAAPQQVAMIVPSPFGLALQPQIRKLLDNHFVGQVRELVVIGADDQFFDYTRPLHWRQDAAISGVNLLSLGILHETACRWAPPPVSVMAMTATFERQRPNPAGQGFVPVTVPDVAHAIAELANGGRAIYHFSGLALHGPGKQIHLYGPTGTMKIEFGSTERLWIGRPGLEFKEIVPAPELTGGWRVEAEFIGAIRGTETAQLNDLETAFRSVAFAEAVHQSAREQRCVPVPQA